jgi:hypothetical protein
LEAFFVFVAAVVGGSSAVDARSIRSTTRGSSEFSGTPVRSPVSFQSRAVGVGHDPDPVAAVRGANGRSRYAVPLRVIPARGQVPEYAPHSSSKESCDVLHDDVAGSKLANESGVLAPKTRAFPVDPGAFAGVGEVLAGEAAGEDVDVWHRHGQRPSASNCTARWRSIRPGAPVPFAYWPAACRSLARCLKSFHASKVRPSYAVTGVGHKGAHVGMTRDPGPVLREDPLAELVLLAEPHSAHTGALQAQVKSPDPAEEASNGPARHAVSGV